MATPTLPEIARATATVFQIDVSDIFSPFRWREYVRPRWVLMAVARQNGYSTPKIGKYLSKDHTTILHGIRGLRRLVDEGDAISASMTSVAEVAGMFASQRLSRDRTNVAQFHPMLKSEADASPPWEVAAE